jgi:DNA-binding transcriptional LysR family regulator
VSRRIAALEKDLNAQLLLESCERIESAMSDARVHSQARRRDKPLSGLVRVATTEAFGTYVITPILAGLHRSNPELQVEIVTQTRLSPYNSGADIEIGLGEPVIGRPGADKLTDY